MNTRGSRRVEPRKRQTPLKTLLNHFNQTQVYGGTVKPNILVCQFSNKSKNQSNKKKRPKLISKSYQIESPPVFSLHQVMVENLVSKHNTPPAQKIVSTAPWSRTRLA